ncbi:cytochrome P450 family protein [Actinacidiphila acidipaludis]|uniref:Cytochrome P450 n=1 Tax=Actinacidiphila acidipaludis TaxID=2873382 RepID=A0ABS7Q4C4_9ACTN|nr:cytochrome P450 [Streptomyces acidipaludis]MBY8878000.1 cytochrome P450 [Streptomyces acidipaludis]
MDDHDDARGGLAGPPDPTGLTGPTGDLPGHDVIDLTRHGAEFVDDPYPVYARLRERGPVHRVVTESGEMWLVVGHDEARTVLADPRLSKDWRILDGSTEEAGPVSANMLESDPPRHTRLRRLVAREFTPRRVETLRPRVRRITGDLLDAMLPAGEADLIESFAVPLPLTVICELLGVPTLDRASFSGWTRAILGETGDFAAEAAAGEAMRDYLVELIEDKRCSRPRDDLLSALIRTRYEDGDRLSADELVSMAFLLLVAGHETTVNLIANGVLALLRHPAQLTALRADPDTLMPGAIEEMLRYDGPVERATYRITRAPYPIGGVTVPAGEIVAVVLAAAGRDPGRHAAPDTFDIRRPPQSQLAFGHGIHFCLGAPLARMEGAIALTELLARAPGLALASVPAPLRWRPNPLMRGLHRLPVTF